MLPDTALCFGLLACMMSLGPGNQAGGSSSRERVLIKSITEPYVEKAPYTLKQLMGEWDEISKLVRAQMKKSLKNKLKYYKAELDKIKSDIRRSKERTKSNRIAMANLRVSTLVDIGGQNEELVDGQSGHWNLTDGVIEKSGQFYRHDAMADWPDGTYSGKLDGNLVECSRKIGEKKQTGVLVDGEYIPGMKQQPSSRWTINKGIMRYFTMNKTKKIQGKEFRHHEMSDWPEGSYKGTLTENGKVQCTGKGFDGNDIRDEEDPDSMTIKNEIVSATNSMQKVNKRVKNVIKPLESFNESDYNRIVSNWVEDDDKPLYDRQAQMQLLVTRLEGLTTKEDRNSDEADRMIGALEKQLRELNENELKSRDSVHDWIAGLVKTFAVAGDSMSKDYLNVCLCGPAGSGKTRYAGIIGNIMTNMGLLVGGKQMETVTRSKLLAQYLGQTAPKTRAMIESCREGVMFIDEAYSLTETATGNDYGAECVTEMVAKLSEMKGQICVIVAGYEKQMLRDSNAFMKSNIGLPRRFPFQTVLPMYEPEDMTKLFVSMMAKNGIEVDGAAQSVLTSTFEADMKRSSDGKTYVAFRNSAGDLENFVHSTKMCGDACAKDKQSMGEQQAETSLRRWLRKYKSTSFERGSRGVVQLEEIPPNEDGPDHENFEESGVTLEELLKVWDTRFETNLKAKMTSVAKQKGEYYEETLRAKEERVKDLISKLRKDRQNAMQLIKDVGGTRERISVSSEEAAKQENIGNYLADHPELVDHDPALLPTMKEVTNMKRLIEKAKKTQSTVNERAKSLKEKLQDLNNTQMESRRSICDFIAQFVSNFADEGDKMTDMYLNMVLCGPAGSGKTHFSHKISEVMSDVGLLVDGNTKMKTKPDLVGENVGDSAPKTVEAIEDAREGILFIDEAYAITAGRTDYGQECITQMVGMLDKMKGQICVIAAGYKQDMLGPKYVEGSDGVREDFMSSNEGLPRRFPYTFELARYTPKDLATIFNTFWTNRFTDSEDLSSEVMDRLEAIFQAADDFKVEQIDKTDTETQHPFQNSAGDVENLVAYVAQRVALNMGLGKDKTLELDADELQDHVNSWLSRNRGVRLMGLGGGKPKKTDVKSNNSSKETSLTRPRDLPTLKQMKADLKEWGHPVLGSIEKEDLIDRWLKTPVKSNNSSKKTSEKNTPKLKQTKKDLQTWLIELQEVFSDEDGGSVLSTEALRPIHPKMKKLPNLPVDVTIRRPEYTGQSWKSKKTLVVPAGTSVEDLLEISIPTLFGKGSQWDARAKKHKPNAKGFIKVHPTEDLLYRAEDLSLIGTELTIDAYR